MLLRGFLMSGTRSADYHVKSSSREADDFKSKLKVKEGGRSDWSVGASEEFRSDSLG